MVLGTVLPVLQCRSSRRQPGGGREPRCRLRRHRRALGCRREQAFVSKYNLNFTNLNDADGSIWARYNVPWQPAYVFYRADGSSTFVNNPTSAMSQQELAGRVAALR